MNNFHQMVQRTLRYTLVNALMWFGLWAVSPMWKSVFSGLAIGSACGVYFAVSASRQAETAGELALTGRGKKPAIQYVNRLLVVMAAVLITRAISGKWGHVSFPAVIVGMLSYHLLLAGVFLRQRLLDK